MSKSWREGGEPMLIRLFRNPHEYYSLSELNSFVVEVILIGLALGVVVIAISA